MKRNLKIRFFAVLAVAVMVLVSASPRVIANDDESPTVSIPIAMATDNNYLVPTLVSIVSASENADPATTLRFYIMVTSDFSEENKSKVQKLNENLANCEITIVDMGDAFKEFEKSNWGTAMYYRLKVGSVLKDEDRCIYLDSDTLVLKDLTEMYNLDIGDNYVAGTPDGFRLCKDHASELEIADMSQYICSGSLLWNLDKLRTDNIEEKFEQFLKRASEKGKKLIFPDQDAINAICYGKIMDMPFRYGAIIGFMYCAKYEKDPYLYKLIDQDNWEDGIKNTVVLHFVGKKPWNFRRVKFGEQWQKYYSDLENVQKIA